MNIVFCAPVKTVSGYGSRSRDLAISLIELGHNVRILATPWGSTPDNALDLSNENHMKIHQRIINNLTDKPDVWIQCTIPNEFKPVGKYNIGITAGIETTVCRPEWIEGCNVMDLVLTSSVHSMNVFKEIQFEKRASDTKALISVLKLTTPIKVLFEGVDTKLYKRKKTSEDGTINNLLKDVKEQFCYLFVGHWIQGDLGHDRKDIGMLIHTFLNTFKRKAIQNRPALILKTSYASFSRLELTDIQSKIDSIKKLIQDSDHSSSLPNIYLIHGELTDEEMVDLYNHDKVKALVSLTKGEGFGRPLLEFTTTGKPVLCSNWSGPVDFLHPDHSVLIPGQLTAVHESAANDWILKDGQWFTTNYLFVAQILDNIYKMYDKYLDRSKGHINITKSNFSIKKMTELLGQILTENVVIEETPELIPFKIPEVNEKNN